MGATGAAALRRLTVFAALLVGVDFLDELGAGVPVVGAPLFQAEFRVSYGQAAGWLLAAGAFMGLLLEPPLMLLADRHPRRWFVCGGLAAAGALAALAGLAPSYWVLLCAMALSGPAVGVGVNLAQATLMDAVPDQRERMMMRWTLAGALGDLAGPLLLSGVALLALGWRSAFAVVAVLWLATAWVLWRRFEIAPGRDGDGDRESEPPLHRAFLAGLRNRSLRPWLVAVVLCTLLDEILIGFGALFLRDVVGAGVHERSAVLGAFMLGSVLSLLAAERLVSRVRPAALLFASAVASAAALAGWLAARGVAASALWMLALGFASAVHYPIAQAQAYRALPERSGTVAAVLAAAHAVMVPAPLLVGLVADSFGLVPALALLGAQPLGLAWIALRAGLRDASPGPG